MRLEELYSKVIGSEELKAAFVAAVKEKKIAEFLKEQGCEATEAEVAEFLKEQGCEATEAEVAEFLKEQGCEAMETEVAEFLKSKQGAEGEMADEELDAVAGGGCNTAETFLSCVTVGVFCAMDAIKSATMDKPEDGWGNDCLLCEPL